MMPGKRSSSLFFAIALCAAATGMRTAFAEPLAIENVLVHVGPGEQIENATILVDGERIKAIGKQVDVPQDARRIDGTGKVLTAGLIDSSSRVGLVEIDQVSDTVEGSFSTPVHAGYLVVDGYNPDSVSVPVAREGGVTSVVAVPRGGLLAGRSAWLRTTPGTIDQVALSQSVAMHAQLGSGAVASGEGSRGYAFELLNELIDDARHYARNKAAFERNQTRRYAASRLDLEALGEVIGKRLPLWISVHRKSDILAALRLARRQGLDIVIVGGTEAWTVAKELAAARVPVILNPAANLPSSFDQVRVRDDAAAILAKAGVPVAISTIGGASEARGLRQLAGIAVANGMTWDQALAAVTTVPAALAGEKDSRVRVGGRADLVLWSGDPFELSSRAEEVIIGGALQPQANHQKRLFQRYHRLPTR